MSRFKGHREGHGPFGCMRGRGPRRASPSRLYRDPDNSVVLGVCAGIAEYFGISVTLVRVVTVLGMFFGMFVPIIIGYFIAAALIPARPETLYKDADEAGFWRDVRVEPSQTFGDLRHRFRGLEKRLAGLESYITSRQYKLRREIDEL